MTALAARIAWQEGASGCVNRCESGCSYCDSADRLAAAADWERLLQGYGGQFNEHVISARDAIRAEATRAKFSFGVQA